MEQKKPTYKELENELKNLKNSYLKLKESQQRYKAIFETSSDGIGISKEGISVFCNDAYLKLFGYDKKEELIGKSILKQISPKEHEKIKTFISQNKKGKETLSFFESIGLKKNGEKFPFEMNVGSYYLGDDKYNVGIIRDISERKKAERELIESNEKFSSAFNKTSVSQIITSIPEGKIYDANEALLENIDKKIEDIKDNSTLELKFWINESDRDFFLEEIRKNKIVRNREYKFRFKSDLIRDCLVSADLIKIRGKDYLLTNLIDITERKRTEEKLKESEMRWHFSVDGSGLGLWDWNAITNEIYYSPQWEKILGFEEHEMIHNLNEWGKRIHPDDVENVHTDLSAHFEGITPIYSNEHRVLCKNGDYKWVLDRGKVVSWTEDNKPERIIGTYTDIDVQKKNQQIFIESIAKFKFLFEQSPVGIYIADTKGNIIDGNQKLLEILGSPSLEATKQINVLKYKPLVANGYSVFFKRCLETGVKQHLEMEYVSHWGKHSYISSYIVPLFDSKGNIKHVYTMMEDVSDRKVMEQELKESQLRLELFFTQSAIGFFFMMIDEPVVWDNNADKDKILDYVFSHQRLTKVNNAMLHQYRAKEEDFIGLTPMDFYGDNPDERRRLWRELFDKGKLHVDTEETKFDGSKLIVTGDYICLYDDEKRIIGHFGALSDVTAEREAQRALEISEERFKNIIESANDWIWEVDTSGKYTYASPQVSKILGYQAEELVGKMPFDIMPEKEGERILKIFLDNVKNKKPISNIENINIHKDGSFVILETSGMPFFDSQNNLLGYRGIDRDITEKKKAIIALHESEELLKTAQNIAKLGYWEVDFNSEKVTWSEQIYQIFDVTPQDFSPSFESFIELLHPDDRGIIENALKNTLNKEQEFDLVLRIILKEKRMKYISIHSNIIYDNEGKPIKSIGAIQDITKTKEDEVKLLEAKSELENINNRLKEAQRLSMMGSWSINQKKQEIDWSDEMYNILDFSKKNKITDPNFIFSMTHPDDIEWLTNEINKAINTKQPFDVTHRICLKNNSVKYVRGRGSVMEYDKYGVPLVINGTMQDVTKERLLQAELIKSEILKKNILASQPILIWAKDIDGVYIACNPEFERFFGAKEKDIIGKTDYDFVEKDIADGFRKHDKKVVETGNSNMNEEWITYSDNGEKALLETTKTPLRDEKGEIFGVLGVSYNVTKRIEREDALREAKQEAEHANRLKSEFLANMSHEIRTPMNAVLGYSEILAEKLKDNPEYLSYVEGINKGGKNLISLINDILDLSKIESGKLEINTTPVDFRNLLEDIKQIFAANIKNKHIDFNINIDSRLPHALMLDKKRIRQVLFNLVGNAIKFTDKGGVNIAVKVEGIIGIKSNIDLFFEVEDTGIGIREQQLTDIFEAFRQTHGNYSQFEGTGLGLAISKRLVEAMNGAISVESVIGKGSVFRVYLKDVEIPPFDINKYSVDKKNELQNIIFNSPQILLVDDVKSNLDVIQQILNNYNCKISTAYNGKEALKKIEEQIPDLILMDIQMPVLDGFETTKILKNNSKYKKIPVIALTALAMTEQMEKYIGVFDGYLTKPTKFSKLIECLIEFLPYTQLEKNTNNTHEKIFDNRLLGDLPSPLINVFITEIFPLFDELKEYFDTDDCLNFVSKLSDYISDYDLPELKNFCIELTESTQNMQLYKIQELLASFDIFRKKIK